MGWFKKKEEVKEQDIDLSKVMIDYIIRAKELGFSDELIRDKFKSKGYDKNLIDVAFLCVNQLKGGKMAKKVEEEEEFDEEQEAEEEEEDSEEESEPEVKPKKFKKVVDEVKEEVKETPENTLNTILTAHEQGLQAHESRLQIIEAKLFRIQNS